MDAYMPSEIARLVLGYLKETGCSKTASSFLEESPHLIEYAACLKRGRVCSTEIGGKSLITILDEHSSQEITESQKGVKNAKQQEIVTDLQTQNSKAELAGNSTNQRSAINLEPQDSIIYSQQRGSISTSEPQKCVTNVEQQESISISEQHGCISMSEQQGSFSISEQHGSVSISEQYGRVSISEQQASVSIPDPQGSVSISEPQGYNINSDTSSSNEAPIVGVQNGDSSEEEDNCGASGYRGDDDTYENDPSSFLTHILETEEGESSYSQTEEHSNTGLDNPASDGRGEDNLSENDMGGLLMQALNTEEGESSLSQHEEHSNKGLDNPESGIYTCNECGRKFQSKGGLLVHKRKHSNKYPYRCNECDKHFNSARDLAFHNNKHGTGTIKCKLCDFKPTSLTGLKTHVASHFPTTIKCPHCEKVFRQESYLKVHMKSHFRKFSCSTCDKQFGQKHHLMSHMSIHLSSSIITCERPNCSFTTKHEYCLKRHMKLHEKKDNPVKKKSKMENTCNICGMVYLNKRNYEKHITLCKLENSQIEEHVIEIKVSPD